jgi:hypothetical protein
MSDLILAVGGTAFFAAAVAGLKRWPDRAQLLRRIGAWFVLQGMAVDAAADARRVRRAEVERQAGVERSPAPGPADVPQKQWARGANQ